MPTGWKPRGPNWLCSLFNICATRWQCGDWMKRNSFSTTLPLKLESSVCLPEGSTIVNSVDLLGTIVVANSEPAIGRSTAKQTKFFKHTAQHAENAII